MDEERDTNQGILELEKKKIAQIVDFINESNNSQLIMEAENIINHAPTESKPIWHILNYDDLLQSLFLSSHYPLHTTLIIQTHLIETQTIYLIKYV